MHDIAADSPLILIFCVSKKLQAEEAASVELAMEDSQAEERRLAKNSYMRFYRSIRSCLK